MLYLSNAFSLSMLAAPASIRVTPADPVKALAGPNTPFTSIVGHADTAALFSSLLGVPVPVNRTSVRLAPGDALLVGQYTGPRLPEGTCTLPEGASITWLLVETE